MTHGTPSQTGNGAATGGAVRPIPDAVSKALARLLVGVNEPMFVIDDEERFTGATESLLTLLGLRDRDLIGRALSDILADAGRANGRAGAMDGTVRLKVRNNGVVHAYLRWSKIDVGKERRPFRVGVVEVGPEPGEGQAARTADEAARMRREQQRQSFNETLRVRFTGQSEPHVAVAGRIEVICLDEIKASLGNEWQRLGERAKAIARGILDRRLSSIDVYAETEDDSFIVCFATLEAAEARFKSEQIAREIRAHLLGEERRSFKVQTQVEQVAFDNAGSSNGGDFLSMLVTQLDEAREMRSQRLEATREQLLKSARLVLSAMLVADPHTPPLLLARVGGESLALLNQIIGTECEAQAISNLDSVLLTLVIKHLFIDSDNPAAGLIVPVHYRTLAERRFLNDYLTLCERMDGATRKRICFELHDIPRDAPASRLQDMFGCLAPFSARRVMQMDGPTPPLGQISRYRLAMVALPARPEHRQKRTSGKTFAAFVGILHGQGCQVLVRGVPDRRAAEWYFDQQVDYLSLANRRPAGELTEG